MVRELIILRRERSFNKVEFTIYCSRMMLLTSALKLPGSDWLRPVFVAFCGLFQSGCQVFKSLRGKKHFHKLTIEDVQDRSQKKQEEQAAIASQQKQKKKRDQKLHTILVPVDREPNILRGGQSARSRGYSANSNSEFNFNTTSSHQSAAINAITSRTRSGGTL